MIYHYDFLQKQLTVTPCLSALGGTLDSPGKMSNFQEFFGVRTRSNFSTGETTKPTRGDMKIQRDELANRLR